MRRFTHWIWIILAVALMAVAVRWLYVETHRGMRLTKDGIGAKFRHLQGESAGEEQLLKSPSDIVPGSVVIDQPGPYYPGSKITATATYDQEARRGNRTPQYPYHPQFQANYMQDGIAKGFYWGDAEKMAASVTKNSDGTFTASGIPVTLDNLAYLPGWDLARPGSLAIGIYNVRDIKGVQTFTCYAWGEFPIEAAQP